MTGYNKALVLQGVRDELAEATRRADVAHQKARADWQSSAERIGKLRREALTIVATALAIDDDEERAQYLFPKGRMYNSPLNRLEDAGHPIPPEPERVVTHREKQLQNVIAIIESADAPTVTVADLRALGVLQFVAVPKGA